MEPIALMVFQLGTDKDYVLVEAESWRTGILGKETVSRVDRPRHRFFCDVDDPLHVEVTLRRVGLADMESLVCIFYVERVFVGVEE